MLWYDDPFGLKTDTDTIANPNRLPIADAKTTWQHVSRAGQGQGPRTLGAVLLLLIAAATGLAIPLGLGRIVDMVAAGSWDANQIWLMAAAIVVSAITSAVGTMLAAGVAEGVVAYLREKMIAAALHLPLVRVERAGAGDLVSRATDDVSEVSVAITQTLPIIATSGFTIVVSVVGMGVVDWRVGAAMLVVVPVYTWAVLQFRHIAPPVFQAERAAMAERARFVLGTLRGVDTVRAFGLQEQRREHIAHWSWQVLRHSVDARITTSLLMARVHAAEMVGMLMVLIVGYFIVADGSATIGTVTATMLLFLRLFGPITRLVQQVDTIQSGLTSLQRVVGVLTITRPDYPAVSAGDGSGVAIRDLTWGYDGEAEPAVQDVSLAIAPGQKLALVGASGAGKTTVTALLAGLRPAPRGTITIDGIESADLSDTERAEHLVLVTQEVHVFDGPLIDDLRLAKPEASEDEVRAALDAVGADWVTDLQEPVGASGRALTPMQAQQLALARVLLADPPLVVLDEATAEAGSTGAERLEQAADEVTAGRSALVVAHRLSQAARADVIAVMDRGRIVEQGSHAELLELHGRYAELWKAWEMGR